MNQIQEEKNYKRVKKKYMNKQVGDAFDQAPRTLGCVKCREMHQRIFGYVRTDIPVLFR
jgi:hypothetical protein